MEEKKISIKKWILIIVAIILMLPLCIKCMEGDECISYPMKHVGTIKLGEETDGFETALYGYNFSYFKSGEEALRYVSSKTDVSQEELDKIAEKLEGLEYTNVIVSKYSGFFLNMNTDCEPFGYIGFTNKSGKSSNKLYIYVVNIEEIPEWG